MLAMSFDLPILFLIFNRPRLTAEVFSVLRKIRPKRLFVAADGPRAGIESEAELCRRTRAIATTLDWECQLTTLFRDRNLGCGPAVSGAITWFFEQVEEGIVLEDDCLPSLSFFEFCKYALEKFRDDPRIGSISGNYFLPSGLLFEQPYYFSKYFQIWGWATWRRAWQKYRFDLSFEGEEKWFGILRDIHPAPLEAEYWLEVLRGLKKGTVNTWDYQMMFLSWRERFLHVAPTKNLVTNIGYGPDATHTNFESPLAGFPRNELKDFKVHLKVCPHPQIDNLTFYVRFLESLRSVWWLREALSRNQNRDVGGQLDRIEASNQRTERVLQDLNGFSHRVEASNQGIEKALENLAYLSQQVEVSNQRIANAQQCLYLFNKLFSPVFALQRWFANRKS
jgi:hypothetical protein